MLGDTAVAVNPKDQRYKMIILNTRILTSSGYKSMLQDYYKLEGQDCILRIWNPAMKAILPLFSDFNRSLKNKEDW